MQEFLSGILNQLLKKYFNHLIFSKETLQQKNKISKEEPPVSTCESDKKIKYRVRGPSLVLRSSVLSMFSSRLSLTSELEEDFNCTKQLTVLKILICDIFFSLADHVTDFIQV